MNANGLAWAALWSWPLVAFVFFAARRGASAARNTAWMLVLPAMFLPSNLWWDLPGLPDVDKYRVASISVAVCLGLFHRRPLGEALRGHLFARVVLAVLIWGTFQTVRTNPEPLTYGKIVLPGQTTYDGISMGFGFVIDYYLPFAIAQRVFRTERDLRDLFEVLGLAGLAYLPLCAVELRLSPQLHSWFYGYHPSEFGQSLRGGGFRPMVFMNHGLAVSMFLFASFTATLALVRLRARSSPSPAARAGLLALFIALSKSLGASLFAAASAVTQPFVSARTTARAVVVIAVVVVAYPTLRASGVVPTADLVEAAASLSPERAASLLFRFDQEEQLLARARERPLHGWGGWGRPQIWKPWGRISIPDGYWIIQLGSFGYVGFGAAFALLVVPLLRFALARKHLAASAQLLCGTLAWIAAIFVLDLLPNSQLGYFQFVWAGALFGLAATLRVPAAFSVAPTAAEAGPGLESAGGGVA